MVDLAGVARVRLCFPRISLEWFRTDIKPVGVSKLLSASKVNVFKSEVGFQLGSSFNCGYLTSTATTTLKRTLGAGTNAPLRVLAAASNCAMKTVTVISAFLHLDRCNSN